MPKLNSRNKGKSGERELAGLLSDRLGIPFSRNLDQARDGGFDLISDLPLAIEVKRQENLQLSAWWSQALRQTPEGQIPALAFRQSRKPWAIVVSLQWLTGLDFPVTAIATITLDDFCYLVQKKVLGKNEV